MEITEENIKHRVHIYTPRDMLSSLVGIHLANVTLPPLLLFMLGPKDYFILFFLFVQIFTSKHVRD